MNSRSAAVASLLLAAASSLTAQPVATIGAGHINRLDLDRRLAIEHAYGGALTREAALVSLVNDAIEREIARSLGLLPDSTELLAFSRHADETSKAPEILAMVKRVFDKDSSTYLRLYLSPRLVNVKLHQFFLYDTALHAAQRRAIEYAYLLVAKGMSFTQAAEWSDLQYRIDTLRAGNGALPPELARYAEGDSLPRDPYRELVSKLEAGKLFGSIVDIDNDYRLLRLMSRDDSVQVIEVIAAAKGEFDEWFRSEGEKIPIDISDGKLRRSIIQTYPQLWWIESIRVEEKGRRKR
jgi:hypothetical protein